MRVEPALSAPSGCSKVQKMLPVPVFSQTLQERRQSLFDSLLSKVLVAVLTLFGMFAVSLSSSTRRRVTGTLLATTSQCSSSKMQSSSPISSIQSSPNLTMKYLRASQLTTTSGTLCTCIPRLRTCTCGPCRTEPFHAPTV